MMISHYGNAITKAVPMAGKNADVLCERGRFVLPERFTLGNAMEGVQKAFGKILKSGAISAGKIGVLISASCSEKQVEDILAFTVAIMPAFVASNSVGKPIPEKYRASVEFAAVKNGKVSDVSELTIGVNDKALAKLGVKALEAKQKAKIESGEIETLFVFGDDICDIDTSKVKNIEIFCKNLYKY